MKKILYLSLVFAVLLSACSPKQKTNSQAYLIILSMDGFRWDYTDSVNTPHFDAIEKIGVKAESMQASFPSKTFPNHYTLVTGLVPNNHGIVNNSFFAPEYDEVYSIGNRETVQNGKFYGGEPIWNTAEKQGLKAASYFWVGSEADIQNMHPSIWKPYEHHFDFYQRADSVISWLSLPESQRPHLITWYVHEPDHSGHAYGPHSTKIDSVIQNMDALLGYFMNELSKHPLADKINVIITSDHGMENISPEKTIFLNQLLKENWTTHIIGGNPIYNIQAEQGCKDSVFNALSGVVGISCYKNPDLPKYLNYGSNPRCLDFTLVADSAYSILRKESNRGYSKGTHGFDISNKNMNAIFYAYGPAFKKGYHHPEFKNVSVYPLMCQILSLIPAPNDGDFQEVKEMLIDF